MTRGRTRKPDPTLPAHIEAGLLPRGIYWRPALKGGGVWWRYKDGVREIVATESANLSDLHAIMESQANPRGSLNHVMAMFEASAEYDRLAAGTKLDYRTQAKFLANYPTKMGVALGMLQVDRMSTPLFQRLVDAIAEKTPSKANHALRYARRVFSYGVQRGHCKTNPAKGVKQAHELKAHKMPAADAFALVLEFARQRGQLAANAKGRVAPYLWPAMEIAFACRLRGIEVVTLTDANKLDAGILCVRRKGSKTNITAWNPRLEAAWAHLEACRAAVIEYSKRPIPMKPELRVLMVAQDGAPLSKSGFDTSWQRMIKLAIDEGVITPEQRFSLHGLKHRGVTDTAGSAADKQHASGHKSAAMAAHYNHAIDTVEPANRDEFFR